MPEGESSVPEWLKGLRGSLWIKNGQFAGYRIHSFPGVEDVQQFTAKQRSRPVSSAFENTTLRCFCGKVESEGPRLYCPLARTEQPFARKKTT
jgi:hypothetical protein